MFLPRGAGGRKEMAASLTLPRLRTTIYKTIILKLCIPRLLLCSSKNRCASLENFFVLVIQCQTLTDFLFTRHRWGDSWCLRLLSVLSWPMFQEFGSTFYLYHLVNDSVNISCEHRSEVPPSRCGVLPDSTLNFAPPPATLKLYPFSQVI